VLFELNLRGLLSVRFYAIEISHYNDEKMKSRKSFLKAYLLYQQEI